MKITKKYLKELILEEIDAGMEEVPMTLWELQSYLRPVAENWVGDPKHKEILMQAAEILKLESGVFE